MVCLLCLEDCKKSINMFTKDGKTLNISNIVSKHFWLKPDKRDSKRKLICIPCWLKVEAFHSFYQSVEEAHKTLKEIALELSCQDSAQPVPCPIAEIEKQETPTEEVRNQKEQLEELPYNPENIVIKQEVVVGGPVEAENFIHVAEYLEQDLKFEWHANSEQIDPIDNNTLTNATTKENQAETPTTEHLKSEPGPSSPHEENNKIESDYGDDDHFNGDDISSDSSDDAKVEPAAEEKPKRKAGRPSSDPKPKPSRKTSEKWQKSLQYDAIIAENMKLTCVICLDPLPNFDDLKRHFRSKHKRDGYAVCCNKRFTKRGILVDHIKLHLNPESFKCPLCGKNMAHRRTLKGHLDMHAADVNNKIFQCDQCPKSFYTRKLLRCHKITHIPEEDRKFKCYDCSKSFGTNYALNNHRRIVHENVNTKICDICGKVIRGKSNLRRHQMEHNGIIEIKPGIQCDVCGITLKNRFVLNRHMQAIHAQTDEKFTCEVCGKVSPNSVAHRRHYYNVHQSERQFQCTLCEKAFKTTCALKEHTATHTNEGLYTCPHCPSTFNSKSNMHTHRKKVHPQEWEETRRLKQIPQAMAQQFNPVIPPPQFLTNYSMPPNPHTAADQHLPQTDLPLATNPMMASMFGVPYNNIGHSPM